jgi:hypothetical protein
VKGTITGRIVIRGTKKRRMKGKNLIRRKDGK